MMLKERMLLRNKTSSAIVAVSDIDRAREFYGDMLGLEFEGGSKEEALRFRTGDTELIVYPSEFAGTNKANAVVWSAGDDFDTIVDQLRDQRVRFEEYPDMGMDLSNGVHSQGDFKGVWFKDPDGNILHIQNM